WVQQAYIKPSNCGAGDHFGWSVALSRDGNRLAVGAPLEDSAGRDVGGVQDENAIDAGAVYLFARSGTTWSEALYVKATNADPGDQFGYSVALSAPGDLLAVGAIQESSSARGVGGNQMQNNTASSGAAYTYINTAMWRFDQYFKASNTDA